MTAFKRILALTLLLGISLVQAQDDSQAAATAPRPAPAPTPAPPAGNGQCYENMPDALKTLDLTYMTGLLPKGNLSTPVIDESLPVTLFVPSDEAWLERAPQLGMNPSDLVESARRDKITFILQHHVVEGAAVDYTRPEARLFPLSTSLSSSPCVKTSPVTVNVTQTPLGLLVQSLGTSALVKSQHSTCGGISQVYVMDDVLNPCCTNMFDIAKSPTLAPVFSSRDPQIKAFVNYFNGPLYNTAKATWALPPTLFVPTAEALTDYITELKSAADVDIVLINQAYRNLTWMHMSTVGVTKESLLLEKPTRTIPTFLNGRLKVSGCTTSITLALRDEGDAEAAGKGYFGTASVGEVKANIVKAYKMCKDTTVYVVDKVLAPCDISKFAPCRGFSAFQKRPSVRAAFSSKDDQVSNFMDYYTGALWNGGPDADWSLPATLLMPSAAAIQEFVDDVSSRPDLAGDDVALGNIYNVTVYAHMMNTPTDKAAVANGAVSGPTRAFTAFKQPCLRQLTYNPTGAGGKASVTLGNATATVTESVNLCDNVTVHVIDKVLVPCDLEGLLPCRNFDDLQKKPELVQAFNTTNANVSQLMDYFTGALWDGESATPGWKLPPTVFLPTAAAIEEYVTEVANNPDVDVQGVFNATAGLHLTKAKINNQTLAANNGKQSGPTFAATGFNQSCLKTVTVSRAASGLTVSAGITSAKVVNTYTLCNNVTVYIIDTVLQPCNLTLLSAGGAPRCKKFYDVTNSDALKAVYQSTDRNLKTFMNYFNGPLYNKTLKDWVIPNTLFIPDATVTANFLKTSVGKNVNSEQAKELYAILFYLHQTNQTIPLDEVLNITSPFKVISALQGAKTDCENTYTMMPEVQGGDSNKFKVKITAGGSTAEVLQHWELCDGEQVYLISEPLVPCDIGTLMKSYKIPKGFLGAAGMRSLSLAATLLAAAVGAMALLF